MAADHEPEDARRRARELLTGPPWRAGSETEQEARAALGDLKRLREFGLLAELTERLVRAHPRDAALRKLQTQALIETGHASAAIEVARAGLRSLPEDHQEWSELNGLIGRAYKQIAVEAPAGTERSRALRQGLSAYEKPVRHDPNNTWHAINLVAMLDYATRVGVKVHSDLDPQQLAEGVIARLERAPAKNRDRWTAATLAEASLALGKIADVEHHLQAYLLDPNVQAFEVGSTLRQFSEVWGLEDSDDPRRRGLVQAMRARLLELPGARLSLSPEEVARQRAEPLPDSAQLQAILGNEGTRSFAWWKQGLMRATSVAAIYAGISQRIGTGFLVPGSVFGSADETERLLITNYHVVNRDGAGGALRSEDAEIAFEALDVKQRHRIVEILWSSPADRHDCSLMRVENLPAAAAAIPTAKALPVVCASAKVYVIGHPGGGELEFSFQDNALLDHEGGPGAKPAIPGVVRLHYRAPTEKGSSGSPVFNSSRWEAVALHHKGGMLSRLNGENGTHLANEGLALDAIAAAFRAEPK